MELESVRADAGALDGILDNYLESGEFLLTLADMHGEHFQIRSEAVRLPPKGIIEEVEGRRVFEAITESSLELVKYIADNDLPWGARAWRNGRQVGCPTHR